MAKAKFNIRPITFFRLLGIILFVIILAQIDIKEALTIASGASLLYLVLALLFQVFMLIAKGFRWHILNRKKQVKSDIVTSFGRFLESYATGVITPGRLGELLKVGHEQTRSDKITAILRVIFERGIDISIFMFVAGLFLVSGIFFDKFYEPGIIVIVISLFAFGLSLLVLFSKAVLRFTESLVNKIFRKKEPVQIHMQQLNAKETINFFLLSLVSNFFAFYSVYMLAISINLDAGFLWVSGAVSVAGLVNILPITIMGLGTREFVYLEIFQGYEQSLVMAFSFLVFVTAQFFGGIFAMVSGQLLIYFKSRNKQND